MIIEHEYIKKILAAIGIIGFLIVGSYVYILYDIRDQTRDSLVLLETLERDVARKSHFEGIESTLRNLEDKVSSIDSFVVNEDGIVSFLELIEELAEEQGIVISKQIEKIESKDGTALNLSLTIEGSWEMTQNMLALIENIPFSITMQRFSARVSEEEGWLGFIEFSVISNT